MGLDEKSGPKSRTIKVLVMVIVVYLLVTITVFFVFQMFQSVPRLWNDRLTDDDINILSTASLVWLKMLSICASDTKQLRCMHPLGHRSLTGFPRLLTVVPYILCMTKALLQLGKSLSFCFVCQFYRVVNYSKHLKGI